MSKSSINLKCLVGTKLGYVKVINGFNLKEESKIKFNASCIGQIQKLDNTYFVSADESIYSFDDLSGNGLKTIYEPTDIDTNIIKFNFIEDVIIACYKNELRIIKNNEMESKIEGGIFDDFCLLRNNHFAVCGENTELTVYNFEAMDKPVFTGKTPANKALSLPAKIHLTSLAQDVENDNLVYCGTQFNTVQLYDIRSNQRKAQCTANFYLDYAVTKILPLASQKIIAASARGQIGVMDFRYFPKNKIPAKDVLSKFEKFKENATGVVSGIAIGNDVRIGLEGSKSADILVTTSFDRQLRVYDIKTKLLLNKTYLGSKGTCVMLDRVNQCGDEDLWQDLEKMDSEIEGVKRQRTKEDGESGNKRLRNE